MRGNLHAHGIGRHNDAEKTAIANRGVEALSQVLGDNRYLLGSEVSGADATAFAFLAGGPPELFESPLQKKLAAMPDLVAYRDRMMAEFFPGFVK